jgi:thiamine kinase-like enzyme
MLDDKEESCIPVHSDLSKSNIIYSGGNPIPIDFSLSGYSYFYMDIGSLFGHFIKDEERETIIRGYRSITGEAVEQFFIEPFLVLQVILFIACQHEKAAKLEWFTGAMDRWCRDLFVPLAEKKPFL